MAHLGQTEIHQSVLDFILAQWH